MGSDFYEEQAERFFRDTEALGCLALDIWFLRHALRLFLSRL